ncbi:hypothetical protein GUJ93_ZPchr0002g24266 [Zizania palustris]|uniref:Uncharacterized protein n=1 Tax=Zizania palustris TaxID=103762 RepID=A0A8J5SII3_ZIZPA|nr:hypothetical protein GUJ93_ZPchr0002g24266 [Zizania palustris]
MTIMDELYETKVLSFLHIETMVYACQRYHAMSMSKLDFNTEEEKDNIDSWHCSTLFWISVVLFYGSTDSGDEIDSLQVEMLLIDVEVDYWKKRFLKNCKLDYLAVILPIAKACFWVIPLPIHTARLRETESSQTLALLHAAAAAAASASPAPGPGRRSKAVPFRDASRA